MNRNKVEVPLNKKLSMKAYGGSEGRSPRTISARGKGVWLASLPGRFTSKRRDALRIAYEAGWKQRLSGRFVEDRSL
jgi:hypothetical protein